MRYRFLIVFTFAFVVVASIQAQSEAPLSKKIKSFQVELRMGIGFDAFEAGFGKERRDSRDYVDLKDPLIKPGINSGIELLYNWNIKNSLSVGLDYFFWTELYGDGNDPLIRWKDQKRAKERYIFNLSWSHQLKNSWEYGFGIVYQGQTFASPGYRLLSGNSISTRTSPYKPWFPDIGFSARLKKFWGLTETVQVGLMVYTHWLAGIGFETTSFNLVSRIELSNNEVNTSPAEKRKINNVFIEVGSGPLVLLRYSNIFKNSVGSKFGYDGEGIEGIRVPIGLANRFGLKYQFKKIALVLNYRNARYKELYGVDADPAGLWSAGRKMSHINMFDIGINYTYYSNNRSNLSVGVGVLRSKEDNSRPFYSINPNGTLEDISSFISLEDWETGFQFNLAYIYDLSGDLKIGLNVSGNFYDSGRGLQSLPINGFISIPIF